MPLNYPGRRSLIGRRGLFKNSLLAVLLSFISVCGLVGCNDVSHAPPPNPGPGPLTIVTTSLPGATVNQPYAAVVGGSGGITPYTWSLAASSPPMPAGLSPPDANTGAITGTPTVTGTTSLVFRLEDNSLPTQFVEKSLPITVGTTPQPLAISTSSLPDGVVNQPYPPTTLQATGGIIPYTWSVSPALPNGLSLNLLSPGEISGTPLSGTAGTTTHTFTVVDSANPLNQTATTQLSLTINPAPKPLAITAPSGSSLTNATVGQKYSYTLKGSGGVLPYTWSITPALPTGLLLNTSTGVITGKPASGTAGVYHLTIVLQDSSLPTHQSTSKAVTLTVNQ
ncbi:MAG: putative Ig domain-containing protein [Nitrospirota bacterium]|nr:putative Ig domain-containing protein [Nitrospirota bacterium]